MNNDGTEPLNEKTLGFLWDKWKHHDGLAYSRWASAMVVEGAILSATIITLGLLIDEKTSEYVSYICLSLSFIWLIAGTTTVVFIKCQETDIRVRNSFNKEIVDTLWNLGLLQEKTKGGKEKWDTAGYEGNADDNEHPINLWHTPTPFLKGKKVRASKLSKWLLNGFMAINFTACLGFFVAFLLLL